LFCATIAADSRGLNVRLKVMQLVFRDLEAHFFPRAWQRSELKKHGGSRWEWQRG